MAGKPTRQHVLIGLVSGIVLALGLSLLSDRTLTAVMAGIAGGVVVIAFLAGQNAERPPPDS